MQDSLMEYFSARLDLRENRLALFFRQGNRTVFDLDPQVALDPGVRIKPEQLLALGKLWGMSDVYGRCCPDCKARLAANDEYWLPGEEPGG